MATNGNNILVYKGGTLIAGMKSTDIQTDCDLQEVSSPGQGTYKAYVPGRIGGTLTIGYLVMADTSALGISGGNGIKDLLQVRSEYTLVSKARNAADSDGISGKYILKTCKISANRGNLVTGSFQFVLNGALTVPTPTPST